jgi:hypothetical protein
VPALCLLDFAYRKPGKGKPIFRSHDEGHSAVIPSAHVKNDGSPTRRGVPPISKRSRYNWPCHRAHNGSRLFKAVMDPSFPSSQETSPRYGTRVDSCGLQPESRSCERSDQTLPVAFASGYAAALAKRWLIRWPDRPGAAGQRQSGCPRSIGLGSARCR